MHSEPPSSERPVPKTFDVWAHLAAMPTPFEHAWQRFGTSGVGAETNACRLTHDASTRRQRSVTFRTQVAGAYWYFYGFIK